MSRKKFDEYSTLNIKKNNFLRTAGFKAAFIEAMAEISYFNIKDNIKIILRVGVKSPLPLGGGMKTP